MLVVETVGRIRREHLVKGKSIKEIARDLKISRNTVRKVLRSGETSFAYEREVQPRPKLGHIAVRLKEHLDVRDAGRVPCRRFVASTDAESGTRAGAEVGDAAGRAGREDDVAVGTNAGTLSDRLDHRLRGAETRSRQSSDGQPQPGSVWQPRGDVSDKAIARHNVKTNAGHQHDAGRLCSRISSGEVREVVCANRQACFCRWGCGGLERPRSMQDGDYTSEAIDYGSGRALLEARP